MSKSEKNPSEERKRKFQTFIYLIGLISVLVLFGSLYRGQMMNNQVTDLSQALTEKESVRDAILDMQKEFDRSYYDLWSIDYEVSAKVNASLMTVLEANITVTAYLWSMMKTSDNYYYTFVDPILSHTAEEAKYAWLYQEGIITEYWVVSPNYDYVVNGTEIIIETAVDETLWYNYTFALMQQLFVNGPTYVEANLALLDDYIFQNVTNRINTAKNQLFQIQLSTNILTIGILSMSFLVDFGSVGRKWKVIYVIIGLVCVSISLFFTYFL